SSLSATGQCSTPRGTTMNSPGPSSRSPVRNRMRNRPSTTRNSSSSASWWCQMNSPLSLTSLTCMSLISPTILGDQCSLRRLKRSARFTTLIAASTRAAGSGALLNRAQRESARPRRPDERPVLLELHRLAGAPVQHTAPALVGRVIEQARQEVHGDEVLPLLLPGLGDRRLAHRNVLQAVDPPVGAELSDLRPEDAAHLRGQEVGDLAEVAAGPRALDLEEHVGGRLGEGRGVEAAIELADMTDAAVEVGGLGRHLDGRGGRRAIAGLPVRHAVAAG